MLEMINFSYNFVHGSSMGTSDSREWQERESPVRNSDSCTQTDLFPLLSLQDNFLEPGSQYLNP